MRPLIAEDAESIFGIFSDIEVTRFWGHSTFQRFEQAREFIEHAQAGWQTKQLLEWGVTERGQSAVVGTCALANWSVEHRRAEIGYALGRSYWGRGIMSEVLPELIRFGFQEMQLNRIEADTDPRNTRSISSLEKLGFEREGLLRQRYLINDELQDAVVFSLLRCNWTPPTTSRSS